MLKLSHIGEDIVAHMFRESRDVQTMFSTLGKLPSHQVKRVVAHSEIKLHRCGDYRFDGAHSIDVGFLDLQTQTVMPCEIKLGLDRLSGNAFSERFLKPCHESSHRDKRIAGNMIAVLDGKLPTACRSHRITATLEGFALPLTTEWYLVLRRSVIGSWERSGKRPVSGRCTIISFEDIVDSYGGSRKFNDLVQRLLTLDYYTEWLGTA